ncbi:GGDEF domain-containing protein [Planococcus antarcticus DSM 14505]|uniref:GGDEF domain-containing protein n=1 Tax=Planococcus antarcticus DSM 14505 TaxID=1185653 RepID=A0ABN4RCU1_9BACL|nr:EAL domain-containing protein [Planococcus antarcticus]ANU09498.1 GGDEF domain-containing protein [Planococcus antarcticus DSM 14505]
MKKDKETELHSIQQVLMNKIPEHQQVGQFLMKDGVIHWFQTKMKGIKDASGHTYGVIVSHKSVSPYSIQPITAEIVLETMTEGFILLDDQLQIIYVNEIAEKLFQYQRRNVVGRDLVEWFPEVAGTSFYQNYQQALREKVVLEFIDYYKPLDIWFEMKVCPLKKGGLALYFQDVSERKKTEVQLVESTYYDYLTGLPNRRLIIETARLLIEQQKNFSILHFNIDNLNYINAVHHFGAGERIIKKFAEELNGFSSKTCHVGRLDGNEFIILQEVAPNEDVAAITEQMQEIFVHPVVLEDSQKIHASVSIGIACFPFDAQTLEELISCADIAMHEAKEVPGSFHSFFHPLMKISYNRKSAIEKGLNGDLKENGFYYVLQPQIDGSSGQLVGAEVLSRWNHPEFGEISPLEFIQIAEESGEIVPLTSHLLAEIFTQIKEWEKGFGWNLRTAINMTPSLLSDPTFFDNFFELLEHFQISSHLLEIEITEQAELTYSPKTLENLLRCKSKGISIAIDDFGTGFSMISYLTHFPINKIKIDQSFVQKIGQNRKSEAVLTSLIHLAHSIECDLVAEGVETVEESLFLQENGCPIHQGYLYDKPLTPKAFEKKYLQDFIKNKDMKELPYHHTLL